mgnify:CR=1 FL=1
MYKSQALVGVILLILIICGCTTVNQQDLKDYHISESQFIIDSKMPKEELYDSICSVLFEKYNKNQQDYFLDRQMGVISVHSDRRFSIKEDSAYYDRKIDYFLKIEIRDKRMRVTINSLQFYGMDWTAGMWTDEYYNLWTTQRTTYYDMSRKRFYQEYELLLKDITNLLSSVSSKSDNW